MRAQDVQEDDGAVTVRVPLVFRKRGSRKMVVAPDGAPASAPARPRVDDTTVKALARAFRWRKLLDSGEYGTIEEIAEAEKITRSYVSRVLRLTLLAPGIVEAILDRRQPALMALPELTRPFPVSWEEQRATVEITI